MGNNKSRGRSDLDYIVELKKFEKIKILRAKEFLDEIGNTLSKS
jgi:hypothetical protein